MNKILRYQYYKNITENYQHKLAIRYYFTLIDESMVNTPEEESETQIIFIDVDISETKAATWNFINDSSYSDDLIKVLFEYGKRELIKKIKDNSMGEINTYRIFSNTHKEKTCPFNPNKITMIKGQEIKISVPSKTSEANIDESSSNQSQESPDAMTDKKHKPKTPRVFISYSHDSEEHKKWVDSLANNLASKGIHVSLDQWDLGAGSDLTKYMEESIRESNRVLMICAEEYVEKSNKRKGGAGYEVMIVSAKIVKNIGTNKFIPIIKQTDKQVVLPDCLSNRVYVNLSDYSDYDEGLKKLIHDIHEVPINERPPLGENPFVISEESLISIKDDTNAGAKKVQNEEIVAEEIKSTDYYDFYRTAGNIIKSKNFIDWKANINPLKKDIPVKLNSWRMKFKDNHPNTNDELIDMAIEGLVNYIPIIYYALAGIESREEHFKDQSETLDYIIGTGKYERKGYETLVDLPLTVAYSYQALHGASCIATRQIELAINLINRQIILPNKSDPIPLYEIDEIVGWPTTLARNSAVSFKYLMSLSDKINGLELIFGGDGELNKLICSYYMLLNYFDFLIKIKTDEEQVIKGDALEYYFPLNFTSVLPEIGNESYIKLIRNKRNTISYEYSR